MGRKLWMLPLLIIFIGCKEDIPLKKEVKVEGYAQGTTYKVLYLNKDGKNYQRSIDSLLIEIDNSLSTYQKNSIISKFNRVDTSLVVDKMFVDVFNASKEVYLATDGAFNPTIAPIVNAWGFGFENELNANQKTIDSLLQYVDFDALSIENGIASKSNPFIMLDFNAIAQGYSVDVLSNFLELKGVENYMVEVGGEIRVKGNNMNDTLWRIGIDKPLENLESREIEAVINLDNKSLATSGNYRKFYEKDGIKYSHTINPKTGYPVEHTLLSATVITDNCMYADAYATAFMVVGLEKSQKLLQDNKNLEALLIYTDKDGNLITYTTKSIGNFIELNDDNQ